MEFAVHRAVAESAHANAGGSGDRKNPRHAARRRYQSAAEPSVFALCIRCLDEQTAFCFLGYGFRLRGVRTKDNKMSVGFTPAVSKAAQKSMRAETRQRRFYR